MSHPRNLEERVTDLDPFVNLKISDTSFLTHLEGRCSCIKCGKSRKYFCYTCHIPIPVIAEKLPKIKV